MTALYSDFKTAVRIFTKAPKFSLGAILTLALGIGPVTAVFSVVYATLYEPMPYPDPDRLVMIWSTTRTSRHNRTPPADYGEFKDRATSFEFLDVYLPEDVNLMLPAGPERIRLRLVTPDGHRLLGEGVALGRDFAADEDQAGKDNVLLISHRIWRTRFDSDPNIIGRQIRADLVPHTIIGVMPPGPQDRRNAEIWKPLVRPADWRTRMRPAVNLVGRLKPGVTLEQAQQEMHQIAQDIATRRPADQRLGVRLEPFHNNFISTSLPGTLWLLLSSVAFVVLIACVNIAYLVLSRGVARSRELAVRVSLGATAWQLVRLTLAESLVLALCGGALGVVSSVWILQGILTLMGPFMLPTEADPRLSVPVLIFTTGVTVLTALLFGSLAAWHTVRLDTNHVLKNTAMQPIGRRVRRAIVLAEVSMAVTLLTGAGLAIVSFWNRLNVDLGVRTERILTFALTLPDEQLDTADQAGGFFEQLFDRVRALPGVVDVSVTSQLPLTGESMSPFRIVGSEGDAVARREADLEFISPDHFKTFGIPVRVGRGFTGQDRTGTLPVAIVSERFAARFLDSANPIGQHLSLPDSSAEGTAAAEPGTWQIVGVAGNVTGAQFGDSDPPKIYLPRAQRPRQSANVAVRTSADPDAVRRSIATAVTDLIPDLPLARVRTMERVVSERLTSSRLNVAFFAGMGFIALLLAGVGVYSAMAVTVAQRTRELGVRLAIGATGGQIRRHILLEGLRLAAAGAVLGLAGAYALGRVMESLLYGVRPFSVPVAIAVVLLILATSLVACYVPARRASTIDPLRLMRAE